LKTIMGELGMGIFNAREIEELQTNKIRLQKIIRDQHNELINLFVFIQKSRRIRDIKSKLQKKFPLEWADAYGERQEESK